MKFIAIVMHPEIYTPIGVYTTEETIEAEQKEEAIKIAKEKYGTEALFQPLVTIEEYQKQQETKRKEFQERLQKEEEKTKEQREKRIKREEQNAQNLGLNLHDYRKKKRLEGEIKKLKNEIANLENELQTKIKILNSINPVE